MGVPSLGSVAETVFLSHCPRISFASPLVRVPLGLLARSFYLGVPCSVLVILVCAACSLDMAVAAVCLILVDNFLWQCTGKATELNHTVALRSCK